jgi:mercuric ion transport protein
VLFSLGMSGAWIGDLTAVEPYKPMFIAIALGFLGYGYWLVYRNVTRCDGDAACAKPLPIQIVKSALWASTALVLLAMFWNWIAPVIAPIMLGL